MPSTRHPAVKLMITYKAEVMAFLNFRGLITVEGKNNEGIHYFSKSKLKGLKPSS